MIAIISLILLIVTVIVSVWGLVLMRKQDKRQATTEEWRAKFDEAARLALKGWGPASWRTVPGETGQQACTRMFPNELRERVESYLVSIPSSSAPAQVRQATDSQLSTPAMRMTITDALEAVERLRREHPDWAKQIGV